MIDVRSLIETAVSPVAIRRGEAFLMPHIVDSHDTLIELADTASIIANRGEGTGIFSNLSEDKIRIIHLDNAIKDGAKKQNQLPSACDFMCMASISGNFILAELTESNERSIEGISGSRQIGKREKAKLQLCNTIEMINRTGFRIIPRKKTAIFFFRVKDYSNSVASRAARAFSRNPANRTVTTYEVEGLTDWEFRNHPYPVPFVIN